MDHSQDQQVVTADSLGSLIELAVAQGGPTVDDTTIVFREGEPHVILGGLAVELPLLATGDYRTTARNVTVPPSWPTLASQQLQSRRDPFTGPTIGLAVFKQTTTVTTGAIRERLLGDSFAIGRHAASAVVHQSVTTNPTSGATCWTTIRHGRTCPEWGDEHQAVTFVAGPGIGSSGVIMWAPVGTTTIPSVAGTLVDSICGLRPKGL